MESPVILENCAQFAQPDNTGFPFDEGDYESTSSPFQSRLNDLAARHPEFGTHFQGLGDLRGFDDFPSLRRKRHPHTGQEAGPSRGFGSAFNRFPFGTSFQEEFTEPGSRTEEKPPEVPKDRKDSKEPRGRKPNPYLPQHLSNTVDLGKQQQPSPERSQRSMSAPPENRSCRVDQEATGPAPEDPMGHKFTRQQQPQPQQQQPKERIIPIHVEGRDDPVMPKNPNIPTETVFGAERYQRADPNAHVRRQAYEQFVPQKNAQQNQSAPQNQQPQRGPTPPQQQQPQRGPTPPQQQQPQRGSTPPQQPKKESTPPPSNDPLDKIKYVRSDVMDLMSKVEQFDGTRKDKNYLYLDEMLTRNLLKLDNVETEGKENIRLARKEAIKCIQTCINNLEAKAQAKEKALKNSESSETTTQTSEAETASTDTTETQSNDSEPQKFTSQATLIISPVKMETEPQKIENQQTEQVEHPVEKMEVEQSEMKEDEKSDNQEIKEEKNEESSQKESN